MSAAAEAILGALIEEAAPAGPLLLVADLLRQLDPVGLRSRRAAERLVQLASKPAWHDDD